MAALPSPTRRESGGPDQRLTLLLADDHTLFREGTRQILERDRSLDVVGEAGTGPDAVLLAQRLRPKVVLLDVALPGLNGIEATRRIRALDAAPVVLILTAHDDGDYVLAALSAGATGYLLKTARAVELTSAVWACARGEVVLQPAIARALAAAGRGQRPAALSIRELEVLRLAAQGLANKEIAFRLDVSVRTVEAALTSAFNRLGAVNRAEAIAQATVRGMLRLEPTGEPHGAVRP